MPLQGWEPSPGYIIRAEVQYSDSEGAKSRFPVIVSGLEFNKTNPEVIVAFTTSSDNVRQPRAYDVEISDKHLDFPQTGLDHSTTVRCGRLWTINKNRISDVIGVVPADLLQDIQRLVLKCFDPPPKISS
ncbi:MAG: type II toxin-antitoxin system PemK/MazF family toxin [Phycisphaerae bacterium]|jgi:mRNA-degrading endonuclease toxin of MazEF toxin-antitoxin module